MKLVPTQAQKEQEIDLDFLANKKAELKQQIAVQKQQISSSTEHLLSPATIAGYFVQSIAKGLNLTDGMVMGYKIMRTVRNLFRRSN